MSKQKVPLAGGVCKYVYFPMLTRDYDDVLLEHKKQRQKKMENHTCSKPHSEPSAAKSFSSAMKPLNTGQRKDDDPAGSANLDVFR